MENLFKSKLKELRTSRNLTQKNLAHQLNLSQSAIARWETGDYTPSMECIIKLAKFFNVSTDYLLGLDD